MLLALTAVCVTAFQDPAPPPPPETPPPAASAPAPSAEERTAAVETAVGTLMELAPRRSQLADGEWSAAEQRMGAAVTAFTATADGLEWEHFARCIQATWRSQCFGACALLCEFTLQHNEPTANLQCQLGMAKYALVQEIFVPFVQRGLGAAAAAAFTAARELGKDDAPEPAILFRSQALVVALDFAGAIADMDALIAHPKYGAMVQRPHLQRARFLLLGDRAADALVQLEASRKAGEEDDGAFMLVRALALAGRGDDAVAKARDAWRDDNSAEHLTLLVDALAAAGKHDEALELLDQHPAVRGEKESEANFAERRRARAALAYVVGLRGKRPEDFIARLCAVLEHEVKVGKFDGMTFHDLDKKENPETQLHSSPPAIASWMLQQESAEFSWANDALYLACVQAMPGWRASPMEQGLLKTLLPEGHWKEITRADAPSVGRAMLATHRMLPVGDGVLTVTKLLAR